MIRRLLWTTNLRLAFYFHWQHRLSYLPKKTHVPSGEDLVILSTFARRSTTRSFKQHWLVACTWCGVKSHFRFTSPQGRDRSEGICRASKYVSIPEITSISRFWHLNLGGISHNISINCFLFAKNWRFNMRPKADISLSDILDDIIYQMVWNAREALRICWVLQFVILAMGRKVGRGRHVSAVYPERKSDRMMCFGVVKWFVYFRVCRCSHLVCDCHVCVKEVNGTVVAIFHIYLIFLNIRNTVVFGQQINRTGSYFKLTQLYMQCINRYIHASKYIYGCIYCACEEIVWKFSLTPSDDAPPWPRVCEGWHWWRLTPGIS